jgi:hypothetical protein
VPEWASFFSAEEYEEFIGALRAELDSSGTSYRIGDGIVDIEGMPGPHGLMNLAQGCHASDRGEWPQIVTRHFANLGASVNRETGNLAEDFEAARPILRVRLLPDELMGGMRPEEVPGSRRYATGVLMSLTYDFPDSTRSVPLEHVQGWPVEAEAVWQIAIDNVRLEADPTHEVIEVRDASFELSMGDDFYVASRCLRLADLLPTGMTNAVFGIPNRHTLIWHGISDVSVVAAIQGMANVAAGAFGDGPGSISNQLYWWRPDRVAHLPIQVDKKGVQFYPPDDFMDLLNALPSP